MLSQEQLEEYRRMTPSERLSLSLRMLREQWPSLMSGGDERVDRKFELLNRQNEQRNRALLAGMAHLPKTR
ncbi:hypothetical protein [Botrimarina sp.]|uniref:hypothetical protein n=1 Tax=Botrimarina sp. TaxID=2795802 RepID=UPI0032EDB55A